MELHTNLIVQFWPEFQTQKKKEEMAMFKHLPYKENENINYDQSLRSCQRNGKYWSISVVRDPGVKIVASVRL